MRERGVRCTGRFAVAALLACSSLANPWPEAGAAAPAAPPTLIDLGAPTGMWASRASAIDASGTVGATLVHSAASPDSEAAVWTGGAWRDLGTGAGLGVTGNGDVVGYTGSAEHQRAALWDSGGELHDLGTLQGGAWSQATAANSRADVVGYAQGSDLTTHAFVWRGGSLQDLDPAGTGNSYAYAINDAGQIVGSADGHAVEWAADGHVVDLGAGESSVAYGINNQETVVGDDNGRAFSWSADAGITYLSLPDGSGWSSAAAINDSGTIVGSVQLTRDSAMPAFHAVVWQSDGVLDLNDSAGAEVDFQLASAVAVNATGDIVGDGVHNGQNRAFLLRLPFSSN